jgi:hypothetical protein
MMKRVIVCALAVALLGAAPISTLAAEIDPERGEIVRSAMTIAGAATGLGVGASIAIAFSRDAIDTPFSSTLLLAIPVAAVGAATGALAGNWIADVALRHQPTFLWSILEGAGLGLVAGAFVGAVTFPVNFVIAYPILEVPEGYWGRFEYLPTLGMAVLAGGLWGGLFGAMAGAASVPVISLYMAF